MEQQQWLDICGRITFEIEQSAHDWSRLKPARMFVADDVLCYIPADLIEIHELAARFRDRHVCCQPAVPCGGDGVMVPLAAMTPQTLVVWLTEMCATQTSAGVSAGDRAHPVIDLRAAVDAALDIVTNQVTEKHISAADAVMVLTSAACMARYTSWLTFVSAAVESTHSQLPTGGDTYALINRLYAARSSLSAVTSRLDATGAVIDSRLAAMAATNTTAATGTTGTTGTTAELRSLYDYRLADYNTLRARLRNLHSHIDAAIAVLFDD